MVKNETNRTNERSQDSYTISYVFFSFFFQEKIFKLVQGSMVNLHFIFLRFDLGFFKTELISFVAVDFCWCGLS